MRISEASHYDSVHISRWSRPVPSLTVSTIASVFKNIIFFAARISSAQNKTDGGFVSSDNLWNQWAFCSWMLNDSFYFKKMLRSDLQPFLKAVGPQRCELDRVLDLNEYG